MRRSGVWVTRLASGAWRAASCISSQCAWAQSSLDGQVQVLEGLKAGDEVVVYSEKELSAGTRIKVVESLAGRQP
jgi:hypothetical protein